jgi:hypothetical protein
MRDVLVLPGESEVSRVEKKVRFEGGKRMTVVFGDLMNIISEFSKHLVPGGVLASFDVPIGNM